MHRSRSLLAAIVLVAACNPFGSTSSPSPTQAGGFALRAWTTDEPTVGRPPPGPVLAIHDGMLFMPGPQMEIFPSPILPNIQQRTISEAGIRAVIAAVQLAGLLDGPTDLTGGKRGGVVAHLSFTIDGIAREVTGDAGRQIACVTTACEAPPGTPEAFAGLWARLMDLPTWIGPKLGPEAPYDFTELQIVLGGPPIDAALPVSRADWPLETPMHEFGVALGSPLPRCGAVEGVEMDALLAAFRGANANTRWTDGSGAELGIEARPLFPDEPDPCSTR